MGAAGRRELRSEAVTVPGRTSLTCENVVQRRLCRVVRSVRIEGVRGSNPLSSTEFLQVRDLFPAPGPQLPRSVSDFGSDLGADLGRGAALLGQQGVEDRHD